MVIPLLVEQARDCPQCLAVGTYQPEMDGGCQYWACTACGSEGDYGMLPAAEGTCQLGIPAERQQHEPPGGPVFLGTIGRRPE
jgi:hypothetical protein